MSNTSNSLWTNCNISNYGQDVKNYNTKNVSVYWISAIFSITITQIKDSSFLLCEVKKKKFFYLNKKVVGFFKEFKGGLSSGRSAWCHSLHMECCLCHLILTFPLPCFLLSLGFRSTTFWEDARKREQANLLLQSQDTHQFQQLDFLFCFVL